MDAIKVNFPFFSSLILFVFSFGELVMVDCVRVNGVRFYVEGYRNSGENESEDIIYNVNLIGGEFNGKHKKKIKSTQSVKHAGKHHVEPKRDSFESYSYIHHKDRKSIRKLFGKEDDAVNQVDSSQESSIDESADENSVDDNVAINFGMNKFEIDEEYFQSVEQGASPVADITQEQVHTDENETINSSHPHKRHSFTDFLKDKVGELKQKAKDLNHKVAESGGIYNATKQKITRVYEKTKQTIDETVQDKINQLHIHISGFEPYPTPAMSRIICAELIFEHIEIHMLHALPSQISHLEAKPLVVEALDFHELGYENLNFIKVHLPGDRSISTSNGLSSKKILSTKSIDSQKSLEKSHANNLSSRTITLKYGPNHKIEVIEENHTGEIIDLFSIDVWKSGLDALIFKYHFERKILYALFKSNAGMTFETIFVVGYLSYLFNIVGRILNDLFTISNWVNRKENRDGASAHSTFHDMEDSVRLSSVDNLIFSDGVKAHSHTENVLVTHPIFFDA